MFNKIGKYLAVLSLSLIVTGNSVLANPTTLPEKDKVETIRVDENKPVDFYTKILAGGDRHAYNIKVEAGKVVKLKVRANSGVGIKVQTPTGEIASYSQDKYFEVTIRTEGEYTVELESNVVSQYSLQVYNR